jgi:hypothetical protein
VKLAVPVTGWAALACPATEPSTPPFRVVLGGVKAPFWPFEPWDCALTPTVPLDEVLVEVEVVVVAVVVVELETHEAAPPCAFSA